MKSGNDPYSKSSFITFWVDNVVRKSNLYPTIIRETNLHKTKTFLGCPKRPSESSRMPNESEADQSFFSSTLKPNDTSYTAALEGYFMFYNVYNLPKELLDAATNILYRKQPKHLDSIKVCWIQWKFSNFRQAFKEVVCTTLGNELFPFLFDAPKELSVSINTKLTDALNILSPECTFSSPPLISLPKLDMSVGIHPRQGLNYQQLQVITMFQEEGRIFAHPNKRGDLFPGLVVECKSIGTRGL